MLGKPELKSSHWRNELIKGVHTGIYLSRGSKEPFNIEIAINMIKQMANKHNFWENQRLATLNVKNNDVNWDLI